MARYQAVDVGDELEEGKDCAPFLRQLHVSSVFWTFYFLVGLGVGAPTVFIPQIRRENSTADQVIDDDLASWIYSLSNFSALPWLFVLPKFSQSIGRKIPYIAVSIVICAGNIVLYFSKTPNQIMVAEIFQGFVNANAASLSVTMIGEYSSRKYSSVFINIQTTTFYWGIWVSQAVGTFANWKYIPILGTVCSAYCFTMLFVPESPNWLASKGKFKECEIAHQWLYGCGQESENDLRVLIKSQMKYQIQVRKNNTQGRLSRIMETVKCRQFYMPLLIATLIAVQYNLSGKFVCSVYTIDIIKKITHSEKTAYTGMLILDGVTVFGMYFGSMLSKIIKTRTLYIKLAFLSIAVMFTISLYLYLATIAIIQENSIISLSLLIAYSLSISCGPIIMSMTLYSILVPMRYQSVSYPIISFAYIGVATVMVKLAPILFKELGIHGWFLLFGILSGICTVVLHIYLPETKGKTLLEIEECFKDKQSVPTEAETIKL